jgi:hypothetical protein
MLYPDTATQTGIGQLGRAPSGCGDDMINFKAEPKEFLRTIAVGATGCWILCTQCLAQGTRQRTHRVCTWTLRPFVRCSRRNCALALLRETRR